MAKRPDLPGKFPTGLHLQALRRPKTPIPEPEFRRPTARQSNPKPKDLGKIREQFRPASPLPCSLRAARRT